MAYEKRLRKLHIHSNCVTKTGDKLLRVRLLKTRFSGHNSRKVTNLSFHQHDFSNPLSTNNRVNWSTLFATVIHEIPIFSSLAEAKLIVFRRDLNDQDSPIQRIVLSRIH